jgi:uncharacterized membrane protein YesL
MKSFSDDTPLMTALSHAADMMLLNLLFFLYSLPVFTHGAACTAMYRVLMNRSAGKYGGVVSSFRTAFRSDFHEASLVEFSLLPGFVLAVIALFFAGTETVGRSLPLRLVCLLPALFWVFTVSYAYPLVAQFRNTPFQSIRNAFRLSLANIPLSLLISVINLMPLLIRIASRTLFNRILIFWILIGFALSAWVNERLIHRILLLFILGNNSVSAKEE